MKPFQIISILVVAACMQQVSAVARPSKLVVPSRVKNPHGKLKQGKATTSPLSGSANTAVSSEGATIPNEIFNLVKSILGAGVLGLPAGIAAFGNSPSALIPALAMIAVLGVFSSYGFVLIGRVCAYTGASSYRDAWEKSVGKGGSWMPALACLLVTLCSVVAYSMILCDTIPQLMDSIGILGITRTKALLGVTLAVLLPLCLLKELQSLAPFSLAGIVGMLYTTLAMAARYFGGQYKEGGALVQSVASEFQPLFGTRGASGVLSPNAFILVSMLSTASMSHYLAPKFYLELRNNTIDRYKTVVHNSFFISTIFFAAIASLGFLTFGASCSGLVLNNYSTKDALMSMSRVAVVVSLLTSYPLAFTGARDGVLDLVGVPSSKRTPKLLNTLIVLLLTGVTLCAHSVRDLSLIFSLGGATWGNAVIYLFPTYMFVQCAKKMPELKKEIPVATATGLLGLFMGIIGTIKSLESAS
ncbi:transmembrane amino acid transporter protein [Fragilaria crotonensis]|nr:transmembrane amino acid transporter protein [Fragilaria crotonensis]